MDTINTIPFETKNVNKLNKHKKNTISYFGITQILDL